MKINNIQNQNFKGKIPNKLLEKTAKFASKNSDKIIAIAGSSVVAQKVVMSGSEAVVGPLMDIGIGKAITKITSETDGSTNESSRTQAIRTFSQSVGGTIVGVVIRLICMGIATAAFMKLGAKAGSEYAKILNPEKLSEKADAYLYTQNMEKWGKNVGGAAATIVMLVTNFIIDAPFINWINKEATKIIDNHSKTKQIQTKEVK